MATTEGIFLPPRRGLTPIEYNMTPNAWPWLWPVFFYLVGSVPTGYLLGRLRGLDIRQHGSGNIGATNVWRVMGRNWGLLTFFLDAAKGWLAVVVAMWLAAHWPIHVVLPHGHELVKYFDLGFAGIAAAMGCIAGHNF